MNRKPVIRQPQNTQQMNVRVPDSVAAGVYSNMVSISASDNEIVLDFVLTVPNSDQAVLNSRVILAPNTAQQMSDLLEALLRERKKVGK